MGVEMLPEVVDPLGDQRDLHFGRTRILVVDLVVSDDLLFLLDGNRHLIAPRHLETSNV
jgi:hypothetical protein